MWCERGGTVPDPFSPVAEHPGPRKGLGKRLRTNPPKVDQSVSQSVSQNIRKMDFLRHLDEMKAIAPEKKEEEKWVIFFTDTCLYNVFRRETSVQAVIVDPSSYSPDKNRYDPISDACWSNEQEYEKVSLSKIRLLIFLLVFRTLL